jgi:hypothetical protein
MKLNCVKESLYVGMGMTLSGAKMYGNCLLLISQILWIKGVTMFILSAPREINLRILSLTVKILLQTT